MPSSFRPHLEALPEAQVTLWPLLAPLARLGLVLYGGTAIALRLGHRRSIDFDFFSALPLDKPALHRVLPLLAQGDVLQDEPETLVHSVRLPAGPVKLSFFGSLSLGRVDTPQRTDDGVLLVASALDLLATKLKVILDRAEVKDYADIAALFRAGVSLPDGLAAFATLFGGEPAVVLKAIGYFGDGDLATLAEADRLALRRARDAVRGLPAVPRLAHNLAP